MEQRLSLVTLAVADLGRARACYEARGWTTRAVTPEEVAHSPSWTITEDGSTRLG